MHDIITVHDMIWVRLWCMKWEYTAATDIMLSNLHSANWWENMHELTRMCSVLGKVAKWRYRSSFFGSEIRLMKSFHRDTAMNATGTIFAEISFRKTKQQIKAMKRSKGEDHCKIVGYEIENHEYVQFVSWAYRSSFSNSCPQRALEQSDRGMARVKLRRGRMRAVGII